MMQPNRRKGILLLLFLAAGLFLIILAGGLTDIPFGGARSFTRRVPLEGMDLSSPRLNYNLLLIFYLLLLGAAFLAMFLHEAGRRRAIIFLAVAAVLGLVLYQLIDQVVYAPPPSPTPVLTAEGTARPTEVVPTLPPIIVEGEMPLTTPDWLVTAIGTVLAALLAGVSGLIYLAFSQERPKDNLPTILAQEAEAAAEALNQGAEFRDVVLNCYAQMIQRLEADRNLPRGTAVTPREFEVSLVRLGFPAPAVHNLTNLFESVRYGHIGASSEQIRQAIESLETIGAYIQELGER